MAATMTTTNNLVSQTLQSTGVQEEDKCVVAQYCTTKEQRDAFEKLVNSAPSKKEIPIEWVIDIADESNGWFYGTAYHYNDDTNMLHVMIPDKHNPTFDGQIVLDFRTVHLIECVDNASEALFNKILRDSIMKIKWTVEWFEDEVDHHPSHHHAGSSAPSSPSKHEQETPGHLVQSTAKYYIRMANQLLVEDIDSKSPESAEFVMIPADLSVKLLDCHKSRGLDDFYRLIHEGTVQFSSEAKSIADTWVESSNPSKLSRQTSKRSVDVNGIVSPRAAIKKISEVATNLKEVIHEMKTQQIKKATEEKDFANLFIAFALNGDLDAGMQLLSSSESVTSATATTSTAGNSASDKAISGGIAMTRLLESSAFLAQKLEKGVNKAIQSHEINEDIENLKLTTKQMKQDLEEKEKEIKRLKNNNK